MKRISLLTIILLTVAAGVCRGRSYCSPRYHTRWSVYKHGLISGDVHYSPYAYQFGHNGLVSGNVRYSPYAFDFEHSGLIYEPYCAGSFGYQFVRHYDVGREPYDVSRNLNWQGWQPQAQLGDGLSEPRQQVRTARSVEYRKQAAADRRKDGDQIVSQYLKSKNIEFQLDKFLRIDGRTVSANFLLKDKNIIIKYWDPEQIDLLESKAEYKQLNYVQYLQNWNDFWCKYLQAGGKVCQIISADKNDIISELERSSVLNEG